MGRGIRRKLFGKRSSVFGRKSADGKHLLTAEDDANAACESDYSEGESEQEPTVKQLSEPVVTNPRKGEKSDMTVSTTPTNSESKHSSTDSINWKTIATSKSNEDARRGHFDNPCSRSTLTFQSQNSHRLPKSFKSRSFSSAPATVVVATTSEGASAASKQKAVTLSRSNEHSHRTSSGSNLSKKAGDQRTPIAKPDTIQRTKSPTSVMEFFSDTEFNSFLYRQRTENIANSKANDEEKNLVDNTGKEEEDSQKKAVLHEKHELPPKTPASAVTSTAKIGKSFSKQCCNSGELSKKTGSQKPHPSSGETVIKSLNKAFFSSCQGVNVSAEGNSLADHSNKRKIENTNAEGVAFSVANTFATIIDTLLKAFNCGIYNSTSEPVGEIFTAKSNLPEIQRLLPPQDILVSKSDDLISLGNITDYTAEWSLAMKMRGKEHPGSKTPYDGIVVANPYTGKICEEASDYFKEYKDQNDYVARGYIAVSTSDS